MAGSGCWNAVDGGRPWWTVENAKCSNRRRDKTRWERKTQQRGKKGYGLGHFLKRIYIGSSTCALRTTIPELAYRRTSTEIAPVWQFLCYLAVPSYHQLFRLSNLYRFLVPTRCNCICGHIQQFLMYQMHLFTIFSWVKGNPNKEKHETHYCNAHKICTCI